MRESHPLEILAPDADALRDLGRALAASLRDVHSNVVITLEGELGAGKTTFAGGVLAGFGFEGSAKSPTYTLIEPYELAGRRLYHLDLYRLVDPAEVDALGLRDLEGPDSVFLIEWPERGGTRIPRADLRVVLRYAEPKGRMFTCATASDLGRSALLALRAALKR